jgi:predicted choloylglycine hydrolase
VRSFSLTFEAIAEPSPGVAWQTQFERRWPAYQSWFVSRGDDGVPSYAVARRMLQTHMPELVPVWQRLVELAGGGDLAARMLALYSPPPLVLGCSQAVLEDEQQAILVRNYDYFPGHFEGVVYASSLTGRRVIGVSDCLWGLLDGINDAGLAISLAFGGRRAVTDGFGIPLVVRYLLETCESVEEVRRTLARLPIQVAYNLTFVDRSGAAMTAFVGPPSRPRFSHARVATNHQGEVEWEDHARVTRSVERYDRLVALLSGRAGPREGVIEAFLEPPLYSSAYSGGSGTLYTAVYRPAAGRVEYRWPGVMWSQSFDAFEQGTREITLTEAEPALPHENWASALI